MVLQNVEPVRIVVRQLFLSRRGIRQFFLSRRGIRQFSGSRRSIRQFFLSLRGIRQFSGSLGISGNSSSAGGVSGNSQAVRAGQVYSAVVRKNPCQCLSTVRKSITGFIALKAPVTVSKKSGAVTSSSLRDFSGRKLFILISSMCG